MLFTPNDLSSSRVAAISGVAHSQPEVWQETVMPLMKAGLELAQIGLAPSMLKASAICNWLGAKRSNSIVESGNKENAGDDENNFDANGLDRD